MADEHATRPTIEVVSATRGDRAAFDLMPLGASLGRLRFAGLTASITYNNARGLPEVYNERIAHSTADILVFVHDDVWIEDYNLTDRLVCGLGDYDVIGLAGTRRRLPGQTIWAFRDEAGAWDHPHLSGAVAHGPAPFGPVSYYGPAPAACELMDGVFLSAVRRRLLAKGVAFDPLFDFHFYDLDFCRTARQAGLELGTWPIAVTHCGVGAFGSEPWLRNRALYLDKWEPSNVGRADADAAARDPQGVSGA